jgi:hypothetical protein
VVNSGDVLNYVTRVMKLTHGKLLRQDDWNAWQDSEFLQLDQYYAQNMFGSPVAVESYDVVFNLVWSYGIKAVDGCKKACCTCDGSTRSGQIRVLDKAYANCVNQTSAWLFYGIAAAESLIVYWADVSNAFAEAPPPKQGFYIRPDKAFHEWWTVHKKRLPIPQGQMIPILLAMQGHPDRPVFGKSMLTLSCMKLDSHQPFMNHVCTLVSSMAIMLSSCGRLMILQSVLQKPIGLISSLICWTNVLQFPSNNRVLLICIMALTSFRCGITFASPA